MSIEFLGTSFTPVRVSQGLVYGGWDGVFGAVGDEKGILFVRFGNVVLGAGSHPFWGIGLSWDR